MALGLSMAGIDIIGLVEYDQSCIDTLVANRKQAFPNAVILKADITKLKGEFLLRSSGLKLGELDILSGGPPCQGFSFAGNSRSIDDPRSKMVWEFARILEETKPKIFIMENVKGLLSFKDFFYTLLETFESKDYVVRFNLINCASYGVPQNRIRVIVIGCRKDTLKIPVFPEPTHFDLKNDNSFPPKSLVAIKCFREHGFGKEEIWDIYWNTKLQILQNKKTITDIFDEAIHKIMIDMIKYNVSVPSVNSVAKTKESM